MTLPMWSRSVDERLHAIIVKMDADEIVETRDLRSEMGVSDKSVYQSLTRAVADGLIERVGRGRYRRVTR